MSGVANLASRLITHESGVNWAILKMKTRGKEGWYLLPCTKVEKTGWLKDSCKSLFEGHDMASRIAALEEETGQAVEFRVDEHWVTLDNHEKLSPSQKIRQKTTDGSVNDYYYWLRNVVGYYHRRFTRATFLTRGLYGHWDPLLQALRCNDRAGTEGPYEETVHKYWRSLSIENRQKLITELQVWAFFYIPYIKEATSKIMETALRNQESMRRGQAAFGERIYRLGYDWHGEWGDGGEQFFQYPLYIGDGILEPDSEVVRRLVNAFRYLDRRRNDVQPNGIVHDIVDPSLCSRLTSDEFVESLVKTWTTGNVDDINKDDSSDEENGEYTIEQEKTIDMIKSRGSFQWVPAVFKCEIDEQSGDCCAALVSNIAGLPERSICPILYADIEALFAKMLPLFAPFIPRNLLQGGLLQVVIKVQEYVLPPQSTYTGRWHTEGFSENILAAGVYYLEVSNETKGGSLLFRSKVQPDGGYVVDIPRYDDVATILFAGSVERAWLYPIKDHGVPDMPDLSQSCVWVEPGPDPDPDPDQGKFKDDCEESSDDGITGFRAAGLEHEHGVRTGTAIAFSNKLPHRFRTITNLTEEPQKRLFINFFLVDPEKELENTMMNVPDIYLLRHILFSVGIVQDAIVGLVYDFCASSVIGSTNSVYHALLRDTAREAMTAARPKFYVQYFGNNGSATYLNFPPGAMDEDAWPHGAKSMESGAQSSQLGDGL